MTDSAPTTAPGVDPADPPALAATVRCATCGGDLTAMDGASYCKNCDPVSSHPTTAPVAAARNVGRCAESMGGLLEQTLFCSLLAGHDGLHHDDGTGADWGQLNEPRSSFAHCRVSWGSHACGLPRGHKGHHFCCCDCADHARDHDDEGCVGAWPYYGRRTFFHGEDAPLAHRLIAPLRSWSYGGWRWQLRWRTRKAFRSLRSVLEGDS